MIITVVASLLMASSIHQSWKLNIFGFRCRYFSSIDSRSGSGPHLPWTDRWRGSGARFERFRFSAGDREIPRADSIETISSSCSTQPPRLTGHHIHWLRPAVLHTAPAVLTLWHTIYCSIDQILMLQIYIQNPGKNWQNGKTMQEKKRVTKRHYSTLFNH